MQPPTAGWGPRVRGLPGGNPVSRAAQQAEAGAGIGSRRRYRKRAQVSEGARVSEGVQVSEAGAASCAPT